MKRASRTIKKFGADVRTLSTRIAKFGAVIATVAAGAMVLFIKQSMATLDVLAKTSARLDIAADKLRGFERIAELTGSQIKTLHKGLLNMAKGIAEAAEGTGEAKDAFEALGLDAAKLIAMKPDEIFLRISDALEKIPNRIQKIGIMSDIFTLRGVTLLNMMELGSVKLREMLADSVRLSGSFSRWDLTKIEDANDAFSDMKRALRSIADRMAIDVSPGIRKMSELTTDFIIDLRNMGFTFADVFEGVAKSIQSTIKWMARWTDAWDLMVLKIQEKKMTFRERLDEFLALTIDAFWGREVGLAARGVLAGKRKPLGEDINARILALSSSIAETDRLANTIDTFFNAIRNELRGGTVMQQAGKAIAEGFKQHPFFRGLVSVGESLRSVVPAFVGIARFLAPFAFMNIQPTAKPKPAGLELPARPGQFMQISPSRFHIPGMTAAGKQSVMDIRAHVLLGQIATNTRNNVAVTT
jgi:hypothetical protein